MTITHWHGPTLPDRNGPKIGKLQDVYVYVDVETDEPQFVTVKEGWFIGRHLTLLPLRGIQIGPDDLQVSATKEQVKAAPGHRDAGEEPSQAGESTLYHYFQLNYAPIGTPSGR